jgi:hypothetical protein
MKKEKKSGMKRTGMKKDTALLRTGVDEKVKKVIDTCIQRSVRTVRPIGVFLHLNLQDMRANIKTNM